MSFVVIPAIDLRGGRVVRLLQGDYRRETVYDDDPPALAARMAAAGARRLHVVDLDGARDGEPSQRELVLAIAAAARGAAVDVGGGIRSLDTIASYLEAAARVRYVVLGTVALREPPVVREACRRWPGRILVGIDARRGRVAVEGWLEQSSVSPLEAAQALAGAGVAGIIYTDIARDGMAAGPNVEATVALARALDVPVIASGGVATLDHLEALRAHRDDGVAGVVVGKAILSGAMPLADALSIGD